MRKIRVYLNADSVKDDIEVEFEVEDDMTDAEIEKEAFHQVMNYVDWYWEEVK